MKVVVCAFNQEKALAKAFFVIMKLTSSRRFTPSLVPSSVLSVDMEWGRQLWLAAGTWAAHNTYWNISQSHILSSTQPAVLLTTLLALVFILSIYGDSVSDLLRFFLIAEASSVYQYKSTLTSWWMLPSQADVFHDSISPYYLWCSSRGAVSVVGAK